MGEYLLTYQCTLDDLKFCWMVKHLWMSKYLNILVYVHEEQAGPDGERWLFKGGVHDEWMDEGRVSQFLADTAASLDLVGTVKALESVMGRRVILNMLVVLYREQFA